MKKRIAVLMGGDSGEYEISIGSAAVVRGFLDKELYEVFPILIRKDGWFYITGDFKQITVDKNDFSINSDYVKIKFDCAFIAIHGTPGEDGKLQGYLDLVGVPYTSCDLTTSAITFNKYFCNELAIRYGQRVAATILLKRGQELNLRAVEEIGYPCFIKPNKSGSSVGVTKVNTEIEIGKALESAFLHDDEVLIQQYIKGREMACGVFREQGKIKVLPVTEIISKKEFFDYEAKYTAGMADEITPANISEAERRECSMLTAELYEKFNCKGVVRFDYFLSGGKWWFLEVNTVPGFSEGSIIPKQAKAAGYNLADFFSQLVEEAISDGEDKIR